MTEYVPILRDHALTFKASSTITGGQLVAVTGPGTVGPAGAASTACIGVAATDATTGDNLAIYSGGVQNLTAAGTITAGDPLICGAAGTVAVSVLPPGGQQVGTALTTGAAASKVRVFFTR